MTHLLSPADVLERIDPVDPDHLQALSNGAWLAEWFEPVGVQIDLLRATRYVTIVGEPFTPEGLPECRAIIFTIEGDT